MIKEMVPAFEIATRLRSGQSGRLGHTDRVRLTDFWERMEHHLGSTYADSWARDYVLDSLGERTVHQALEAGEDTKVVWRAVCEALRLPPSER